MKVSLITGNKSKAAEIGNFVSDLRVVDIDLPEVQEVDTQKVIEAKLKAASSLIEGAIIVEDTSLYLDCIPGLPGPLIKWFQKTIDLDGIYELASRYGTFGAYAVVSIGLFKNGEVKFFEGKVTGKIVAPRGNNGFGWDPIFQPDGNDKTFAEMDQASKDELSMRKIAAEKLATFLNHEE